MTGKDILHTLEGPVSFSSSNVTLRSMNLLQAVSSPIAKLVPLAGKLKGKAVDPRAGTQFKDLKGNARFEGGRIILVHPMTADTSFGQLSLEGYVHFDRRLHLIGAADISPDTVSAMTGGKFRPKRSVKTPVRIGGTLDSPTLEGIDVSSFIDGAGLKELVGAAAAAAAELARKQLEEVRAEAERLKKETEEKARATAARLVEETKKKAADAQRQAEETKRKATEELKRQAEEAKRKAQEQAKKAAAEAKSKAGDTAKEAAQEAGKQGQKIIKGLFGK
jgi:hypothetical protein